MTKVIGIAMILAALMGGCGLGVSTTGGARAQSTDDTRTRHDVPESGGGGGGGSM